MVLASLLDDGKPSPVLFERVIGSLVDELSARFPGQPVRAFSEMVDLLCKRGDRPAAAELEELSNRLGERQRFSLFCAYRVDLFDSDAQLSLLPQICQAHTRVQPGGDVARLGLAVGPRWSRSSAARPLPGTRRSRAPSAARSLSRSPNER